VGAKKRRTRVRWEGGRGRVDVGEVLCPGRVQESNLRRFRKARRVRESRTSRAHLNHRPRSQRRSIPLRSPPLIIESPQVGVELGFGECVAACSCVFCFHQLRKTTEVKRRNRPEPLRVSSDCRTVWASMYLTKKESVRFGKS
jgi:hypothetical protein